MRLLLAGLSGAGTANSPSDLIHACDHVRGCSAVVLTNLLRAQRGARCFFALDTLKETRWTARGQHVNGQRFGRRLTPA